MLFDQMGDRYVVRLESGEPVLETLLDLLRDQSVAFANVSGAGAVSWARLAYWNADRREYEHGDFEEQLEVVSFQGNAALREGQPFLHLHTVLGRQDFSVIAGHLVEARAHPTLEVWLRTEDVRVRRSHDDATGLDLLDLPKRRTPAAGSGPGR